MRLLVVGVGQAVATLPLFSDVVSSQSDERLCVMRARPSAPFTGRHLVQAGISLAVSCVYFAVAATTQNVVRLPTVSLLLVATVLVCVPLDAPMSFAVARELEGALALFSIIALQPLVDPDGSKVKLLPLRPACEISTCAVGMGDTEVLRKGVLHSLSVLTLCALAAWRASMMRLGIV